MAEDPKLAADDLLVKARTAATVLLTTADDAAKKLGEHAAGPFEGMPVWTKVIGYLGFPVVVASSLLYFFTSQLKTDHVIVQDSREMMRAHMDLMAEQNKHRGSVDAAMLRALSQICVNGAATRADRSECAIAVVTESERQTGIPPTEGILTIK